MDACKLCDGPHRADKTVVQCPGYVGSAGKCWDCHLNDTEGRFAGVNRSAPVRAMVTSRVGAKRLSEEEATTGLDDDLSGGCFVPLL
jgi:hypothetical protein